MQLIPTQLNSQYAKRQANPSAIIKTNLLVPSNRNGHEKIFNFYKFKIKNSSDGKGHSLAFREIVGMKNLTILVQSIVHLLLVSCIPPNCPAAKNESNEKINIPQKSLCLPQQPVSNSQPSCNEGSTAPPSNGSVEGQKINSFRPISLTALDKTTGNLYCIQCSQIALKMPNSNSYLLVFKEREDFEQIYKMYQPIVALNSVFFPVIECRSSLALSQGKSTIICNYSLNSTALLDFTCQSTIDNDLVLALMGQLAAFTDLTHSIGLVTKNLSIGDFVVDQDYRLIFIALQNLEPLTNETQKKRNWESTLQLWKILHSYYKYHTEENVYFGRHLTRRIRELQILIQRKGKITLDDVNLAPGFNPLTKQLLRNIKHK